MKLATFDLEIAKSIPEAGDWKSVAPLGITCAAIAVSDAAEPRVFECAPQMSRAACAELVAELERIVLAGYTLVTWNGTAFDFAVLAQESDMARECAELALGHVDLMAIVTFKRGHFLGLQKALDGSGIPGKLKQVRLNDGTMLSGMYGAHAPKLWADGEYSAVLSYLRQDVSSLLTLAEKVARTKQLRWTSTKGNPFTLTIDQLWSVQECFELPLPDTAWMKTDPPQRKKFIEWMPPLNDVIPVSRFERREVRELPLFAYATESDYWREFRGALSR